MGWNDFYRRNDVLNAVVEHARRNPAATLPFDEIPEVAEVFDSLAELLRALHHRWFMALTGRVELALAEAERDPDADPVEVVSAAWRSTAAWHDVLRRLLDTNVDEHRSALRAALEGEQRMLALASGLAKPNEPKDEITRIGATYFTLMRNAPERTARRRNPVEQLLRRLVPSA
ncbi:MAG TPA: hypothetical protein VGR06_21170 [Actinophytocola sp.]|jgi:hypothetical protein|uniref:hypothetical protein n=1 Tax=Actinophytocola sp. TaxID=1872138 RepID=UPI002E0608B5|nr:hypothetical protein [Actinophytocola sp.]